MTITQHELAHRLRAARQACRLTQDEVARHLGLSRPTVAQLEAGNRSVSSLELDRLAQLFGRDLREFVAESFAEEHDALSALFRSDAGIDSDSAVMQRLRQLLAIGREIAALQALVGIDRERHTLASYPLPSPTTRWDAIQQGQRLAEEERRRLLLGVGPLPPLAELLESLGICAGIAALPEDISGLCLFDRSAGMVVVANSDHHPTRRRFSFAHEYAHCLADSARTGMISRASARDDLLEVRANAFAAAFLMPEASVRQFVAALGKGRPSRAQDDVFDETDSIRVEGRAAPGSQALQLYDVVLLAHHFGASRPAVMFRLRNLRLITARELQELRALDEAGRSAQLARLLGLEQAADDDRQELRHRLLGLGLEALRRDAISRAKLVELAAMVGTTRREAGQLIDEAGVDAN